MVVADQVAKWEALRRIDPYHPVVLIPGFFDLTLVRNTGGAFGILRHSTWWLVVAAVAAIVAIAVMVRRSTQPMPGLLGVALALPLGGAVGNVIDRVRLGQVTDFLHAHAGSNDFPVFNVADSCICIGVGLLMIFYWSRPLPEAAESAAARAQVLDGSMAEKDS